MGNTYLTRERRSTADIELKRRLFGARRLKSLLAKTTSFAARTVSIQPLGEEGAEGDDVDDADVASSKPKSLQMRVGKVREKKWREWSGGSECRNDSMASQVEEIWCGADEARMVLARSWDLERESTAYECGTMVGIVGLSAEREIGALEFWPLGFLVCREGK